MKNITTKQIARSVAGVGLALFGASAFAATTWTQNLVADCLQNVTSQACSGSPAVTVSGWSTGTGTVAAPTAGSNFAAATVYNYGSTNGLGIVAVNEDSTLTGPHATDNIYGTDAMMIRFTAAPVTLSSLSIGWNGTDNASGGYTDSDLSVLAWTGGSSGPTMTNASLDTLLASGWSLVGNYANVGGLTNNTQTIASALYSSYWLISAYSSSYFSGTSTQETTAGLSQGNDAFKVLSIAGNTCAGTVTNGSCGTGGSVPEPGSLALMGAAMMGFVASRRRKSKAA